MCISLNFYVMFLSDIKLLFDIFSVLLNVCSFSFSVHYFSQSRCLLFFFSIYNVFFLRLSGV